MGEFGEGVRGGGGDEQEIGGLGFGDVVDALLLLLPERGDDLVAGERGEGERFDELFGGAGHHDVDVERVLLQGADELGGFVGGDAAGNAEGDLEGKLARHEQAPEEGCR